MSEFLAEARILVRPDTTRFRAQLQEEVNRAVSQARIAPLTVPIVLGAAGAGLATAAAQTAALTSAQVAATQSALGLASGLTAENQQLARGAVLLEANSAATAQKAGADVAAASAAGRHANAQRAVTTAAIASGAGMLGLRGAVLTASAGFIGATVAFQALGQAVDSAGEFEQNLNVFRVTAGATADEMDRVTQAARALGRDLTLPGVSANNATEAMLSLARAGLSVEDSIAGSRGALQLATAAQTDFANAANIVAGNLNAFGLAGTQATRVADALAASANESQISIEDTAIGLRQVAGAAQLLGLSLEDTVALLTQLTRAGLAGSDAGTTLRVALVKLSNPDTRQEVERLVGSLTDLNGNLDPEKLVQFGEEITASGDKLDQTGRLYEIFGENALRVIGLLAQEGVPGFQELQRATNEAGIAAETAGARMEGFRGDVEVLKNELADTGLTIGGVLTPALGGLARGTAQFVGSFNDAAASARNFISPVREGSESITDLKDALADAQADLENYRTKVFASEAVTEDMEKTVDEAAAAFGRFGISVAEAKTGLDGFDIIARGVEGSIQGLIDALEEAKTTVVQGRAGDGGLNPQQILNRVTGFDAAEVRARIRGDTDELVGVLESEQAFLISQLDRAVVRNRPALKRQLESALLGVTNDLATVQQQSAAETKRAAREAGVAQQEADRALLELLSNRRADLDRAGERAQVEGRIGDAIRFEDRLQALIKQQIAKIRAQVDDEKARKAAIRELRLALISSRQEEDALRQERAQEAAARREEGLNLDIEFAEITGNVSREISARQRLIALLRKQQAAVKKGTAEWKQLRNEIAEQQAAIKEAKGQAEETQDSGKTAQQFFFEQLQAQQGFASNLLGNLITGPTSGLVGIPSPPSPTIGSTGVGAGIAAAAALQEGKQKGGPTAGQANTTNTILERILRAIVDLNRNADTPEAVQNKRAGSAVMDGIGGGSGSASVM